MQLSGQTIFLQEFHHSLHLIALATQNTLFEGRLWLVGGSVRDWLLKKETPQDFDIVYEGDSLILAQFLKEQQLSSIDPIIYPRFGTAKIRVQNIDIEIVTARKETYEHYSRKPNIQSATLIEDALRRDFTFNTLLLNLHTQKLYDPLEIGLKDLESSILRTPVDPNITFHEDPLRMLRAIRFRWKLCFEPSEGLYQAIKHHANRLNIISKERIRDEINKMLLLENADSCIRDLYELNLLKVFAPELLTMIGVEQGEFHHLDVWEHSLLTLKNIKHRNLLRSLAALLHDIGKPSTRFIDEKGRIRFFGHENIGSDIARDLLKRLKYPYSLIEQVCLLIKNHMRPLNESTDTALRRIIRDLGSNLQDLTLLIEADTNAHAQNIKHFDREVIDERFTKLLEQIPYNKLKSPLSGLEIMSLLNITSGPLIGKIKTFLDKKVISGCLNYEDKEKAAQIILDKFKI